MWSATSPSATPKRARGASSGASYEYFLSRFADAEGKRGGEFYTPRCVVRLLPEMLEPYEGRVYDPCCGSSGMFVQSVEFIRAHASGDSTGGGTVAPISIWGQESNLGSPSGSWTELSRVAPISIWGQESNYTTWRLARMNLAIRGIEGRIEHGDTFHNDRHPDLRADFILANPPFNVSDWGGDRLVDDQRWQFGVPPKGNANFAWVQHIVHHLAPTGAAGFVSLGGPRRTTSPSSPGTCGTSRDWGSRSSTLGSSISGIRRDCAHRSRR